MRLVTTERYLDLVLKALETTIIPDLQSESVRATAGIVQAVVAELLKRERGADTVLEQQLAEGATLLGELQALSSGARPPDSDGAHAKAETFTARLPAHATLSRQIDELSKTLAETSHPAAASLLLRAANWEMSFYRQQREPLKPVPEDQQAEHGNDGRLDRDTLQTFVRNRHPQGDAVTITDFSAVPGGYGKQTSRFTLRDNAGTERKLISRKSDASPMVLNGAFLIDKEYALVKAVSDTGYPAPTPLWLGTGVAGVDADFYVHGMPARSGAR